MTKFRLDHLLVKNNLVLTRSQAESWIKLGRVKVNGKNITKPGYFVDETAKVSLNASEQYVSRAGLKLASVAKMLGLKFNNAIVLDVGSSTGGFTDYSLQHGAKKVIAVDVGTDQLHPSLQGNFAIELHEKTDIRDIKAMSDIPDIVVIDVSFISLREILPHVATLCNFNTNIAAMVKPQFEAGSDTKSKGVIKNDAVRRKILKDFEIWAKQYFVVADKADSDVAGAKGNRERFYLLKPSK
ncbi:MAG: TlyA family RNA methyltransferase [Candidatus Woesebacteria bacterium]|jgi:23S rRNA (cytidine1920-2'-O)/16S rRNA (cytidine1409-2'-O)-methyltransferase